MRIHFCGGADTVTGSQHLIEVGEHRVLRDCGMFQGRRKDAREINEHFLFDPTSLDAMILSHAHIDHSGNIPSLARYDLRSEFPIFSTESTCKLCEIMLRDSAHIQEQDAAYLNHKKSRSGWKPVEPLYETRDAEAMLECFATVDYHVTFEPAPGFRATAYDAGHILGSTLTHFELEENGRKLKVGFVVDLGRKNLPMLRDPEEMGELDVLVMESTYGNRRHVEADNAESQLEAIINKTYRRGGKVIIPSFALERAQELLYHLASLIQAERIPRMPIYVDSPMATAVSRVFMQSQEFMDREFRALCREIGSVMGAPWVHYTSSVADSEKVSQSKDPSIVISASGMCEFGRILHHLKHTISDAKNSVVIVGYQAPHTLGRRLVENQHEVKIFGETYTRRAEVAVLNAFSGHADRDDLLEYAKKVNAKKTFLVHGDDEPREALAETLRENGLGEVFLPKRGEVADL